MIFRAILSRRDTNFETVALAKTLLIASSIFIGVLFICRFEGNTNTTHWVSYNHVWGYSINLPESFKEAPLSSPTIQPYYNIDNKNISISVEYYTDKSNSDFLSSYQNQLVENKISYKLLKNKWFVVTGVNNAGNNVYNKVVLKSQKMYVLKMSWGKNEKTFFEPLIKRIEKSFK